MEAKSLPIVEMHIHPPLSYKMTMQKVGALIKKIEIKQGTTLSDLFDRLDKENHEAWRRLYDRKTKRMRPPINVLLNGKALSSSILKETILEDGDQITLFFVIGGG